jgi:hypothetical protein
MRFGHQYAREISMTSTPFRTAATAAALALAALSTQAFACDPIAGALVGGGIGAVVGNGPGAAVGAVIGSTIAATTPCYDDRRYYAPPRAAYYEPRYAQRTYDDRRYYAPAPAYADQGYAPDPGYAPAPAYAAPPPTYYQPAPTYYAPAPAYYQPAPYYYNPGPVVVAAALAAPYFIYRGARFGRTFRRWH